MCATIALVTAWSWGAWCFIVLLHRNFIVCFHLADVMCFKCTDFIRSHSAPCCLRCLYWTNLFCFYCTRFSHLNSACFTLIWVRLTGGSFTHYSKYYTHMRQHYNCNNYTFCWFHCVLLLAKQSGPRLIVYIILEPRGAPTFLTHFVAQWNYQVYCMS